MAPFASENVIVQVKTVTDVFAKLNVASGGATVVVSAETPAINTSSQEFAGIVNQEAISNLPINNGRWSSFALLTPGAVNDTSGFGLISFRGISTLLNNSTVDGGDNNQAFSPKSAAVHASATPSRRLQCRNSKSILRIIRRNTDAQQAR
jgi:hypothetical protein